jgi:DNA-binding HxlR family transcriptional regulator
MARKQKPKNEPKNQSQRKPMSRAATTPRGAPDAELRSMCPIAAALDLLGDRWTLLVLRDVLLFGKHLYRELEQGPERISTNTLSERLRRLEAIGILERRVYQSNPERCEYHATEKGRELTGVLRELVLWGARHVPGVAKPNAAQMRAIDAASRA